MMTAQSRALDELVRKGHFEPQVAMAVVEAIDTTMSDPQIVTVPILDARLAEIRAEVRISAQVLKSEIARVEHKIDSTRESLEKTIDAASQRTRADVARWVLLAMLGSAALSTAGAFVTHAIHQ